MRSYRWLLSTASAVALTSLLAASPAAAQDWFTPGGGGGARPPSSRPPGPPGGSRVQVRPAAPPPVIQPEPQGQADAPAAPAPQVQVPLPPLPEIPAIAKGTEPPPVHAGVLALPEVMHDSTAAQEIERVLGERRQKLQEDLQKEQAAWRELQQQLISQRASLTPEQIRAREQQLQERVTNAQRSFRDRDRIIQESAQYSLAQIQRALYGVLGKVAESRGINLVVDRQAVVLNANDYDLTAQVVEVLNKALPHVIIPPDGVSPAAMAAKAAADATPVAPGPRVTPAAAPVPPTPPAAPAAPAKP